MIAERMICRERLEEMRDLVGGEWQATTGQAQHEFSRGYLWLDPDWRVVGCASCEKGDDLGECCTQ
jgi:hypothetical protein